MRDLQTRPPEKREDAVQAPLVSVAVDGLLSDEHGPIEMTLTVVNRSDVVLVPHKHIRVMGSTQEFAIAFRSAFDPDKVVDEIRPGDE